MHYLLQAKRGQSENNSFCSCMMLSRNVLFNLLIVNNWTQEADGLLAVTGTKMSRWYFISFHLVAAVAMIHDSFFNGYHNNPNIQAKSIATDEAALGGD